MLMQDLCIDLKDGDAEGKATGRPIFQAWTCTPGNTNQIFD